MAPHENVRRRRVQPTTSRIEDGAISSSKADADGLRGFDQLTDDAAPLSNSIRNTDTLFADSETEEHRSCMIRNNPMAGMTFPSLCRLLLWDKFHEVDWWRYKARISCLFGLSLFNSCLSIVEWIYIQCFLRRVFHQVAQDDQPPLFVLGHARTGTTLLHSLLALDTDRFTTCSTFCAGFPHAFLSFEGIGKRLFAGMLSPTRPMDNMRLHFDLPQEEELATCLLTGGRSSPYMSLYFMRQEEDYRPFQTFRDASPINVSRWTRAFQWLCCKLKVRNVLQTMKNNPTSNASCIPRPNRLLLKSPCHTGRIRHLLQLYPNAQFVFVHRHPIDVFLSSVHLANTTYGFMYLQRPNDGDLREYILQQGELLLEEYIHSVEECDELQLGKNLVQVSFDDLTSHPYETIQSIYNGLEGMKEVFQHDSNSVYPDKLKEYCENLKGYRKNQFDASRIDDELLQEIQRRWKIQFETFGYSLDLK